MFRFTIRDVLAALLIAFLVGCQPPPGVQAPAQPGPPAPPPPPGSSPPSAMPALGAAGFWNQSQVEQLLREDLGLATMALKSTGNHGYQGTGSDADGYKYTLTVKQVSGGIRIDWSTATGHGQITQGNPVP